LTGYAKPGPARTLARTPATTTWRVGVGEGGAVAVGVADGAGVAVAVGVAVDEAVAMAVGVAGGDGVGLGTAT
jgi:hypothetical protein